MTDLERFRAQKDHFYKIHPQSPLTPEQRASFAGLRYFPENPELRLVVAIEAFDEEEPIVMQTTTGGAQEYLRYGRLHFSADGQEAALTLYSDGESYFMPFADALAGEETYSAGRYLEPQPLGEGRFLVDFNLAYNPYCAYNDAWSCPITPRENRLAVAIRAGEKLFDETHR